MAFPGIGERLAFLVENGNPTGCSEKASAFSCSICDSHGLASIARYDWRCRWQNRATLRVACGNCSPTGCLEKACAFSCPIGDSHGLGSSPYQDCKWRSQESGNASRSFENRKRFSWVGVHSSLRLEMSLAEVFDCPAMMAWD